MKIVIQQENTDNLGLYSTIPISFEVNSIFKLISENNKSLEFSFIEEAVTPWIKNYDEHGTPEDWNNNFDMQNWGIFSAFKDLQRVGGVVIAYDTPGVHMLEGRTDLAVLWDIRVHPDYRGLGIGRKLFSKAENFAQKRKCKYLKIETQNINVPACRFYQKQGSILGCINRFAYESLPNEIALYWYKKIR